MVSMEVAPAQEDLERQESRAGSAIFPIRCPCACCPGAVLPFIPGTWQVIQDWTHLSLVLGVASSFVMVGGSIYNIIHFNIFSSAVIKDVACLVFIIPCLMYFIRIIGQYDDRLQAKQKDAKERKEQLTKAYNNLLSDMDTLLTKSAESSAGLAERSFESKRRDFQRFLERAKSRYSNLFNGSKAENDALIKNFRQFVLNWLRVFEECSINPIECPKRVVTMEELNRCQTIGEVCDLTLERLRVTEVRFISIQRDQDAQMLRKTRAEFRRVTATPDPRQIAALTNGEGANGDFAAGAKRPLTTELAVGAGSGTGCTWCSIGSSGCGCSSHPSADGYPKELGMICFRLVILSREHFTLIMGFVVGVGLLVFELWDSITGGMTGPDEGLDYLSVAEVVLNEICIIILLTRFEEIDVIQQLEREVVQLKEAEKSVQVQREKMNDFWSQAQHLTELWLYRTVPRLDLYKEVHSHLEDAPYEAINPWMEKANKELEDIEKHLGPLEDWRNEGNLGLEQKKAFGKTINQLCQEQEFDEIAKRLEALNGGGLKCLQAAPEKSGEKAPTEKKGLLKSATSVMKGTGNLLGVR